MRYSQAGELIMDAVIENGSHPQRTRFTSLSDRIISTSVWALH